ncbi:MULTISPECIES: adenylate/guanylate cyclase domain-containing protein [unclassified Bradyrhizobium]|uniref:adenylate/guanylate cyclase domain-containing protein n=1 Tax=unclassified Bradyrhizobium TaxID=2631580 RepID=UPI00247B1FB0|nr:MULTISPECIES: adenylate/guanylate cyclase domain-containing protein [unclassified Bradyrhizobium]WGR73478.1 adenylate/guanylate cyclase domain-containing protein [Bradyrhizobium sp. ISRA426]WGR78315.1 adenylate/guanylate cyclase domain-containing protein [Bradyrhizobium sp. ISRA430]WGR88716.1 adenylate/guanylate cyclase domain-containing protein [Bradyrhizobium sp. ISRA432]
MRRIGRRDIVAAILIALLSGALFNSPPLHALQGLSLDILTALRGKLVGDHRDPATSPVIVVAIDGETYDTAPFKGSPTLTWTREIGRVLGSITDGGAKAIGFDIIFPSSIEQSEIPFGEAPLGARMKGFDRDYLIALRQMSDAGKLVLGEILSHDHPDVPYRAQQVAVRNNVRALNVHTDPDDIIRRMPLSFPIGGKPIPAMAVELASRALGAKPEFAPDGAMTLAGYAIPSAETNTLTLNFRGLGRDVPTYSFADLHPCVEKDDPDFFRRAFDGKVVLLGTVLNFEDRKLTSMRLSGGYDGTPAARCALPAPAHAAAARSDVAGVFVHATAVRNLMERDAVTELGFPLRTALTILFAMIIACAACVLTPASAMAAYIALTAVYAALAVSLFVHALALPLTEPALAGLAAIAMMIGYRFVIADRDERFLRKSFALYLAPEVIDTMIASGKMPALGGEIRNVTMFFSDLTGFSSIAEKMTPGELVALMNRYLSAMTDIIESHGGYVDKYIGDSIVAMFGAPADDPAHARNAVRAALKCHQKLAELNAGNAAFAGRGLSHRIGLNSGEAVVGNIGSRRRFNYTVMSDTVNVASRLEGANKYYATSIMASEMTVAQTTDSFAWRELDAVRVLGRHEVIKVFEPLAERGAETAEQMKAAAGYAEGLAHWRAREFAKAADCFDQVAATDAPSALFAKRAKELATCPPSADWTPVNTLKGK